MSELSNPGRNGGRLRRYPKGVSGNPNGRPLKLVSHLNAELLNEGYRPVSSSEVIDAMQAILNLPASRLRELSKPGGDEPYLFKLLAKELLGKRGAEALERMLDRVHGKPKQAMELNGNLATQAPVITVQVMPPTRSDG